MQNIALAAKLKKGQWKSALIVDGEFQDAHIGESLSDMVLDAVAGILSVKYPEGQEINVQVTLRAPKPSRNPTEGTDGQG